MSEKTIPARSLLALVLAAAWLGGCGEDEERKEREQQRQAAQEQLQQTRQREYQQQQERHELQKQVNEAKRQREQDRRVLEAKAQEAQGDTSAATLAWISTSLALILVIFLLCRERHLRKVIQRLLTLVLKGTRRQT